eukprot:COSAG04_NODE_11324_length_716_cov_1.833063_1_plen_172_part_01
MCVAQVEHCERYGELADGRRAAAAAAAGTHRGDRATTPRHAQPSILIVTPRSFPSAGAHVARVARQHGLTHRNHGHRRHAFPQCHSTLDSPEHANATVACDQGYEHRDELLVDRLSLGYLVYNKLNYAEAIVRAPTPVGPAGMRTPQSTAMHDRPRVQSSELRAQSSEAAAP